MASKHSQIEALLYWVQSFDFSELQNEDDVETKFVIKFLEFLGYTSQHRRGKYPVKIYRPGKRGRNPEIDNVYFSTTEIEKQGPDTSLLLVEAKKPDEANLEKDVAQAEFYGDKVKILFHIVTNGHHLKVFKRHRHRDDECIFDASTSELMDEAILRRLYKLLHFDVVKSIKELAVNDLSHDLYVEVSQTLHRHPDLLEQFKKEDFNSYIFREGRRIVVSKPMVAMECQLPLVYREGSCQIEFSNIMLRGLTCQLTHNDVLHDLLIGLHTPPDWEARGFIKKTANGTFEANLGQTTVLLSEQETYELCSCVDVVGQAYKDALIEATELLEAWDYQYIQTFEIPGLPDLIRGFSLISVRPWLWELMKQFANEFDYVDEKSDWHIFNPGIHSIGIHQNKYGLTNVTLWPLFNGGNSLNDWVDVLYYDPDEDVILYEYVSKKSWKQFVGVQGIWTVRYTHDWILKKFIPKVLSHYDVQSTVYQHPIHIFQEWFAEKLVPHIFSGYKILQQKQREAQQEAIIEKSTFSSSQKMQTHISEASELQHLTPYLHYIQSWLAHYGLAYRTRRVAASLLQPYYVVFTEVLEAINHTTVNIGYIEGKLGHVERKIKENLRGEKLSQEEERVVYEGLSTIEGIIECLHNHVNRIHEIEYESTDFAEIISQVFISIAEGEKSFVEQDQLNNAKQALLPLWQQSRFDERFIRLLPQ